MDFLNSQSNAGKDFDNVCVILRNTNYSWNFNPKNSEGRVKWNDNFR